MPANSKTSKPQTKETPAPAPVETKVAETKAKKVTKTEAPAPAPVVEATPQKGAGKAKKETAPAKVEAKVETPAKVEAKVETAPAKVTKATKAAPAQKAPAQKAGGAKAKAAPKAKAAEKPAKQPKVAKKVEAEEEGDDDEKGVRSFKVQLPGNEEFTGRFTGLTPYQAANKALSKYFRENKTAKNEITFSIRESTRGSKRSTYTYNGKREKLGTPVKYSIKGPDGNAREIVKEYKNKLTKVKKSETKEASA